MLACNTSGVALVTGVAEGARPNSMFKAAALTSGAGSGSAAVAIGHAGSGTLAIQPCQPDQPA